MARGQVQEAHAAGGAHGHGGGELVVGGQVDRADGSLGQPRRQGLHPEARLVHRHWHEFRSRGPQGGPGGGIARVLHGHPVAGPDQGPRHQVQGALAAARDHQAAFVHGQAAHLGEEPGQGGAQPRLSARIPVPEQLPAAEGAAVGPGQEVRGHEAQVW